MITSFGIVRKEGTAIEKGSRNWESRRLGAGQYEILFTPNFKKRPSVVVTGLDDMNTMLSVRNLTHEGFEVVSWELPGGEYKDAAFSFTAMSEERRHFYPTLTDLD